MDELGDQFLEIRLHQHLQYYQPRGWVVPIHNVAFASHFLHNEALKIQEAYNSGIITQQLEAAYKMQKVTFCDRYGKPYPWYILEGIKDYFDMWNAIIKEQQSTKCDMCTYKHPNCAYGNLRGSQSCLDNIKRIKEWRKK